MRRNECQVWAAALLNTFALAAAADRTFAGYSNGMKPKFTIAAWIINIAFVAKITVLVCRELPCPIFPGVQCIS
jgi:ABC-type Na+ transport system ATPase subunit NatA